MQIKITNARAELEKVMTTIMSSMGENLVWLPEYDKVAEWLEDNHGKGLLLYGSCGRGKSLLTRYAIPALIRAFCQRIVSVVDCGSRQVNIDEILRRKFISLDDIGVEVDRIDYGTRRSYQQGAGQPGHNADHVVEPFGRCDTRTIWRPDI